MSTYTYFIDLTTQLTITVSYNEKIVQKLYLYDFSLTIALYRIPPRIYMLQKLQLGGNLVLN